MGGSNSCRTEFRYSVLMEGTANKNDDLDSELNLKLNSLAIVSPSPHHAARSVLFLFRTSISSKFTVVSYFEPHRGFLDNYCWIELNWSEHYGVGGTTIELKVWKWLNVLVGHFGMQVCWGFWSKGDTASFPSRASFVFSQKFLFVGFGTKKRAQEGSPGTHNNFALLLLMLFAAAKVILCNFLWQPLHEHTFYQKFRH